MPSSACDGFQHLNEELVHDNRAVFVDARPELANDLIGLPQRGHEHQKLLLM